MNDEELVAEAEDLLRTSPPQSAFMEQENDEILSWLGRAAAVLKEWDPIQSAGMGLYSSALQAQPKRDLSSQKPLPDVLKRSDMILESRALDRHGPAYRECTSSAGMGHCWDSS